MVPDGTGVDERVAEDRPAEKPESSRRPAGARRQTLRGLVDRNGFVSVATVAAELGVSEMTIRRDLGQLESQKLVVRTHGGAIASEEMNVSDRDDPSFDTRSHKNVAAKVAIGAAAARIARPGETIGLDVGTTTYQLARCLADRGQLKIFTNNLRAAMVLSDSPHQIYISGGQVRGKEHAVYGSIAVAQLRNYWLDHVFIGVSGLTEAGCFDYSLEDTEVKQVYIERASQVIVVCDSSKFNRQSVVRVCDLDRVDVLVTETQPPADLERVLRAANVRIVVANSPA